MSLVGLRIRRFVGSLLFVVFLAVALGGALLTRFPDSTAAERAAGWPIVGRAVEALRARYLPAAVPPTGEASAESPALEREAVPADPVLIFGEARPTVWVDEGAVLRAAPDESAAPVATLDALTNLPLVERRGDWAWVDFRGVLGWVVPRPEVERGPVLGSRPDPVLPIAARPPEPALLQEALGRFRRPPSDLEIGAYPLYTDWIGKDLLDRCRDLVAGLEEAYRERFRLTPVGEPAEAILLFSHKQDYEAFWRVADGREIEAVGHAGHGIVATYVGLRPPAEICATLIHELTHLLNRRAIGPALPPWLEEGMATEIAARHGAGALEPRRVGAAARQGRLPRLAVLLELDRPRFHDEALRRVHYEQSALWVRFLLDDPQLDGRLLEFLDYLARGGPYAPGLAAEEMAAERATPSLTDDLVAFLGEHLDGLESRFRLWLAID